MFARRKSRVIHLGEVPIGGDNPIVIQSMTNTPTRDAEATLNQVKALAAVGCQVVRVSVPDQASAEALPAIIAGSPVPLVADIHFNHRLALASLAAGIQGLRLNPGNMGNREQIRQVVEEAKVREVPIRIGVNGGSLAPDLLDKYGGLCADALVENAQRHLEILEDCGFFLTKLSLKSSDLQLMLEANEKLAAICDYPLHLGLTEAGTRKTGAIRSAAALGALLSRGIGDTIRVSLSGDPLAEVPVAKEILKACGLRDEGFSFIVCPTCARTTIDVAGLAEALEARLAAVKPPRPLKIAVMGCVVNGPGEAREADIGVAGAKGAGMLFIKGQALDKYPQDRLEEVLYQKIVELCQ